MKTTLPILILVLVVLACGRFQESSKGSPTPSSSPAAPKKVVDLPGLVGKSRDEIVKIVGSEPTTETDRSLFWRLPLGSIHVNFNNKKALENLSFHFTAQRVGDQMILGLDRADQLGDMVGIDVHGKSPTKDDGGMYVYYDHPPINGKPVKKLSFTRSLKKFDVVWIDFE